MVSRLPDISPTEIALSLPTSEYSGSGLDTIQNCIVACKEQYRPQKSVLDSTDNRYQSLRCLPARE